VRIFGSGSKRSIPTNRLSDWLRHEYDPAVYDPLYEPLEAAQRGMGEIATIKDEEIYVVERNYCTPSTRIHRASAAATTGTKPR